MLKKGILLAGLVASVLSGAVVRGQAFSVPVSDKVIEFNLLLPNGKAAKVLAREGSMITIHDNQDGSTHGFVPKLEENDKSVALVVLQISDLGGGRVDVKQAGYLRGLIFGSPSEVKVSNVRFEIEPHNISKGLFPDARPVDPRQPLLNPGQLRKLYGTGGGDCCVRCYSITICASSVTMDCGACNGGAMVY